MFGIKNIDDVYELRIKICPFISVDIFKTMLKEYYLNLKQLKNEVQEMKTVMDAADVHLDKTKSSSPIKLRLIENLDLPVIPMGPHMGEASIHDIFNNMNQNNSWNILINNENPNLFKSTNWIIVT